MDQGDCELALAAHPGGHVQRAKVAVSTAVPYANDDPIARPLRPVQLQAFGIGIT